jgi:D-aminopeptidase
MPQGQRLDAFPSVVSAVLFRYGRRVRSSCVAFALLLACPTGIARAAEAPRKRARELGIVIGTLPTGPHNAITDVSDVRVGHVTLRRGDGKLVPGKGPVRTGVTAIVPHGGDLWRQKVPAATFVLNGAGEMTGSIWVDTQGALEVPILLTNTMSVGRVMDGVVAYMLARYPGIGVDDNVVAPTVAECDDSSLNDARGLHVTPEDAVLAITSAKRGPVEEGAVGAGTGMIAFDFKAGIGTSSRVLPKSDGGYTVGVLVNANMDRREGLRIDGVPVGREIRDLMPGRAKEGSIIAVIATDAPLDHLALKRLASKAALGLARTGASARNGSGDIFIAFSTANRVPHQSAPLTFDLTVVADDHLSPLFVAAEEATEEAIVNALTMAVTTVGRDDFVAHALPLDRLVPIMRAAKRIK